MIQMDLRTFPEVPSVKHVDDASTWDAMVASLRGHLLQTWKWGEFKSLHDWVPARVALSSDDVVKIAAQVLFRRVGPFSVAYVPRGPIADDISLGELAAFTQSIDTECRRHRSIAVLIEPEGSSLPVRIGDAALWSANDVLVQPRRTIKVSVQKSDEDLLGGMKPKTRYNVRLAQRRGVSVRRGDVRDVPTFYDLLQETSIRDAFGVHSIEYFDDMLRVFGDDAAIFIAEFESEPAAALLALRSANEVIYMYGATATKFQRHMPAYLIQFAAMRWARDSGCESYDLWGIPTSEAPPTTTGEGGHSLNVRDGMWGVYRFKQGFGGETVGYPGMFERVYLNSLMSAWRRLRPNLL